MAQSTNKSFLDLAGLKRYDEKIKAKLAADDAATLKAAEDYTDGKIGTLDTGVATVAAGILAEKNRAEGVEGTLTNLTTTAQGSLVAAINEVDANADAANTAIGADTTEGTVKYRIAQLETAVGAGGSVDTQITTKINALDADFSGEKAVASTSGHVTIGLKEEDGKITTLTVADSDIASASALADLQAVVGISKLGEGESTIDARLDVLEGDGDGSVAKALSDAKDYADGKDTAMDARVDALEATHATKTVGEGDAAHTVYQTVAEEAAAAVATVVDNAPEAFDTLKEIADWINKNADGNAESGFDAAQRIVDLETAVGASSLVVADGKTQTVANAIAKAVADEKTRIDGVVGTPDEGKTIQAEIDAVEASITTLNGTDATTGSVANSIKVAIEGLDAEKEQTANSAQALSLKVTEVDGKITAISGDIETITNDDIDALFATPSAE